MQRKLYLALFIAAFVPILVFASGKIRGKVTDAGTGEPLVGANVVVVGSQMGAATNVSGEFVILNVPAETYALKTSYVGYQTITLSNLRVNNDLTTEANFQLPAEGVTVGTVEIVAERPLVNKNATNAVRIIDNEFFAKIPARGLATAIATQPGVVVQNNNIYIRGGRQDEVGYRIDNVGVNDIMFGGQAVNIAAEAVEQIQVMAGGYNAEYGGANAGLVMSSLRTGGDAWHASGLVETDRYASMGKQSLGGFSYGYSDLTATVGGSLLDGKLRVFGSYENTFYRDGNTNAFGIPAPRTWGGFDFSGANAVVAELAIPSVYHPGSKGRDTLNLTYPAGQRVNDPYNRNSAAGSLVYSLGPLQLRGSGSYSAARWQDAPTAATILDWRRMPLSETRDGFANLRISHAITPTTFYEVNFNYYGSSYVNQDPDFKNNLALYGDSAANAAKGYLLAGQSLNFQQWKLYAGSPNGLSVWQPGSVLAGQAFASGYDRIVQRSIGGRIDLTSQYKQHEFKVGGEYTRYTVRRYNVSDPFDWAVTMADPKNNNPVALARALRSLDIGMNNIGYDVFGNQVDGDVIDPGSGDITDFGPAHPVFAAAYVQDKFELSDVVMNLGLRFEYINPDSWDLKDPTNIKINDTLKVPAKSNFVKTPTTKQISPRVGFSFPVTDRTVFHAQYGKFVQQSRLRDSYYGMGGFYGLMYAGRFITGTVGWGLLPERTTQYEIGFAQQISDAASFDVTAFYKNIEDQIQFTIRTPGTGAANNQYASLVNGDFATTKGLEFKLQLRRTNRVSAQVNYTFSDARATGSNPASLAGAAAVGQQSYLPHFVFPSSFNSAHEGSILLDYRFAKDDGGQILEQMGLNVLLRFNSGYSYTRLRQDDNATTDPRNRIPIGEIGASTTPWFFELDARLDKTVPIGPLQANFFIYVINLLGTDNVVSVFPRTGDARDDGWLSTASGQSMVSNTYGQRYADFYKAVFLGENANNFGPPRQIRFGVKLDY